MLWLKITGIHNNGLVKQWYMIDYKLHEMGLITWCIKMRLFLFEFRLRIKDCYLQECTEPVNKNSKLSLFRNLIIEITPELY